jgi:hypothetical protein
LNFDALSNLNRCTVWNCFANSARYNLGAAFFDHLAGGVAIWNALLFADHVAHCVAYVLGSLFANHVACLVAYGLLTALWDHFASGIGANLGSWFANHFASGAVYRLLAAFWNHFACGVGANLAAALRNQFARRVFHSLAAALRNALGYGVRTNLGQAFRFVANTVDFLGFAAWNPNLFANRLGWALNAFYSAGAWAVYVSARRRIEDPSAWLTYGSANDWTSNFFRRCLPATAVDRNSLGVVDRFGDGVVNCSFACFCNRNHYRVVDDMVMRFHDFVHHRVVDYLFVRFTNRGHDGIVHNFGVCFVHRSLDCVVDHSLMGFANWNADRVVDDLAMGFIHRARYVVGNLLGTSFVDGSSYRIVANTGVGFANWHVDNVRHFFVVSFSFVTNSIDRLVFVHDLINGLGTGNCFGFVDGPPNCFHYGVSCWTARVNNVATAVFITDRAAICSLSSASAKSRQHCCERRKSQKLFHSHSP